MIFFEITATSPSSRKINSLANLPTAKGSDAAKFSLSPLPISNGALLLAI